MFMSTRVKAFSLLFFYIILSTFCFSQETNAFVPYIEGGKWSIMLNYGTAYGISQAMNGSHEDFFADLSKDYNNSKFPFGSNRTSIYTFGGELAYKLPQSSFSPYYSIQYTEFYTYVDSLPGSIKKSGEALMGIITNSIGCEYLLSNPDKKLCAFVRLGINTSTIFGHVNYIMRTNLITAQRFGFETEAGGRLRFPKFPFSIELALNYNSANLIGKSYTKPPSFGATVNERALNDGANPDLSNDKARAIDFVQIKFGIKFWL